MTPWLLFGAGGTGVGARTLELALAQQRPVVAVIRHPETAALLQSKGVQVFIGDACDASVVSCACHAAGPEALVISSMGETRIIWRTEPLLMKRKKWASNA